MTFDTPHRIPWLNQLVMMWSATPEPKSRSPSLEVMQREQDSPLRRARMSAQISAIGVRDIVEPPIPTESPSRTKEAASSSETTFSRRPRSRFAISRRSSPYGCGPPLIAAPFLSKSACGSVADTQAHLVVHLVDHAIPGRHARDERAPERLVAAAVEFLDGDTLLLDPRVVAEVEDALALRMRQLEDVVVGDALEMAPEDLAGGGLVEALRIAAGKVGLALARIHLGAVGRDRHDDVLRPEVKVLRELDRGDDVGKPRDADIVELADHLGIDLAPSGEIAPAGIAAEEQVEPIARCVRDADHQVGVHDVVDERDVLVPDALDIVLAIAVLEHGRAFERLDGGDLRAVALLQEVAGRDGAGRARRRDEGRQPQGRVLALEMREHAIEGGARAGVVDEVVREL